MGGTNFIKRDKIWFKKWGIIAVVVMLHSCCLLLKKWLMYAKFFICYWCHCTLLKSLVEQIDSVTIQERLKNPSRRIWIKNEKNRCIRARILRLGFDSLDYRFLYIKKHGYFILLCFIYKLNEWVSILLSFIVLQVLHQKNNLLVKSFGLIRILDNKSKLYLMY